MSAAKNFCYEYPRPAVTVDAIVFTFSNDELKVLLIQRADEPFKDRWAFPGGFINDSETADDAVKRELMEETGLTGIPLDQFYTASDPGRDPRGWTISVVFIGFITSAGFKPEAGDDAKETRWHSLNSLPPLAFDHDDLLKRGLDAAKTKIRFVNIADKLLQKPFSKNQFLTIGKILGYSDNDINQRFQRFLRIGLMIGAGENDMYYFNEERIQKIQ